MIDAAAVDDAVGVRLLLLLLLSDGETLAVKGYGNAAPAFRGVDGEASLAIAALDGGGSGEEGRHGQGVGFLIFGSGMDMGQQIWGAKKRGAPTFGSIL